MKTAIFSLLIAFGVTTNAQVFFEDTNGKYGMKDANGTVILAGKFDGIRRVASVAFSESTLEAVQLNGKWGYVNQTGEEVIPFKFENACNFIDGISHVELEDHFYYIDTTGNYITPALDYRMVFCMHDGFAAVSRKVGEDIKFGLIDNTGKEVLPTQYDSEPDAIGGFSEGLLCIELGSYKKEKYGYINTSGVFVIPLKFDSAEPFKDGKAQVTKGSRTFYIDRLGKEIK